MTQTAVAQFNPDQLKLVRETVAKGTTEAEFKLFIEICRYRGLNPFARQIYAIVRSANDASKRQMTIQTSIDGYRLLAENSGRYAGQVGPEWCGDDGIWKDVWLLDKPPVAARVGILRKDFSQVTWGVAKYKAFFVQQNPLWTKMPDHMLAIRAEAIGLRKAFPDQMSGIYTKEEMEQADDDLPTVAVSGTTVEPEPQPEKAGLALISSKQRSAIITYHQQMNKAFPAIPADTTYAQAEGLLAKLKAEWRDVQESQTEPLPQQDRALREMIAKAKARCATLQVLWQDAKTDAKLAHVADESLVVAQVAHINQVLNQYQEKLVAAR